MLELFYDREGIFVIHELIMT